MKITSLLKTKQYTLRESTAIQNSKVCFVNFSNGRYIQAQQQLIKSIKKHTTYDILTFTKYEEIGSPSHQDSPYEFKLHAINTAKNRGYEIVIWCDASVRLIKPIDDIISKIEEVGIYVQEDGWMIGQWTNDKTLSYFGISREDSLKIPNAYACIFAIDFKNSISSVFLDELFKCSTFGLFKGKWNNNDKTESQDERCLGHRHDQSCIELICLKLNIKKQPLLIGDYKYTSRYFTSWNNP